MLTHVQTLYQLPVLVDTSDEDSVYFERGCCACGVETRRTDMYAARSFGWADIPPLAASLEEDNQHFYEFEDGFQVRFVPNQRLVKWDRENDARFAQTLCGVELSEHHRTSNRPQGKFVSFSNIEIREHSIIIGDHPMASTLPISLGWEHSEETTIVDIDNYEQGRGHRRCGSDIRMSYFERKNRLKKIGGLSETTIVKAERRFARQKQIEMMQAAADI